MQQQAVPVLAEDIFGVLSDKQSVESQRRPKADSRSLFWIRTLLKVHILYAITLKNIKLTSD
ncbi:MAG: hypothetical protein WCE25_06455 [Nitrososphaeraceae archaeon]